jgi:hypothetical protein
LVINGKHVQNLYATQTLDSAYKFGTGIAPVTTGDVVSFYFTGTSGEITRVNFIPGIAQVPIKVEKQYPLQYADGIEIETGEKWSSGKPIYLKTFSGRISLSANVASNIILDNTTKIEELIDYGGYWKNGDASSTIQLPASCATHSSNSTQFYSFVYLYSNSGILQFYSFSSFARADDNNSSYRIWVKYTKK